MALWTDVIDPETLTGYARASMEDYEQSKGSLVDYLPNEIKNDIVARFVTGKNGLVDAAEYRAYDAEIKPGEHEGRARKIIELPALGKYETISEYDQLRLRNATDDEMLSAIQDTTNSLVRSVVDRMEYMRGLVLTTGKATIDQSDFKTEDDFGRDPEMSVTEAVKWGTDGATVLDNLIAYHDAYVEKNGEAPGVILMSNKILRAISRAPEFQSRLADGATRPATVQGVQGVLDGYQLPQIRVFDRKVRVGGVTTPVIPGNRLFMLPAAGDSGMGKSYWGRTLTSTDLGWGIPTNAQGGIVAAPFKNEKPPVIAQVYADAIGLPVLADANLAFTAQVID